MQPKDWVVVTDRGGHLHNALQLISQVGRSPDAVVTTHGPDIDALRLGPDSVFRVPYLFTWVGKKRLLNPVSVLLHIIVAGYLAFRLRPRTVVSLGATNVVIFCWWARLLGAQVIHVECMNQVKTPSITGRMLYPICDALYVQWPELLSKYGPKALYEGWVL